MLKKLASDNLEEWDCYIGPILFAYTEIPLKSLRGYSLFEVLQARTVRGPMNILKEMCDLRRT